MIENIFRNFPFSFATPTPTVTKEAVWQRPQVEENPAQISDPATQELVRGKKASAHDVFTLKSKLSRLQESLQSSIQIATTLLSSAAQDTKVKDKIKSEMAMNLSSFQGFLTSTSEFCQELKKKMGHLDNLAQEKSPKQIENTANTIQTESSDPDVNVMDLLKKIHLVNLRLESTIRKTDEILTDFEQNPASRPFTQAAVEAAHDDINAAASQNLRLCKELEGKMDELMQFAPEYFYGKAIAKANDQLEGVMDDLEASLKKFEDNEDEFNAVKLLVKQAAMMRKQQPATLDDESAVRIYLIAAETLSKRIRAEFDVIHKSSIERKKAHQSNSNTQI